LSWSTPTITTGKISGNITYTISYISDALTGDLVSKITTTNTTVTLPTTIQSGVSTILWLTISATARDGGSNTWTVTIGEYTLTGLPNAPTITKLYDTKGPSSMLNGI